MRALKFLDEGAVGRFSRLRWPVPEDSAPGAWVEAGGDVHPCMRGIHACTLDQVPYWLGPELYVIELDGEVRRDVNKIVAPRGRLLCRVDRWDADLARAFAAAATLHARDVAASILRAEGEGDLADRLAACADVDALADALPAVQPASERALLAAQHLGDAARFSRVVPFGAAYGAAYVGLSEEGYLASRAWQARWLAGALGLDAAIAGP